MTPLPIDEESTNNKGPSVRGFFLFLFITVVTLFAFGGFFVLHRLAITTKTPFFTTLRGLIRSSDLSLRGEKDDRINILLLGMGGAGHDGGYLADTILLASVQPSTRSGAMISLPRDLVIPLPNKTWRKINVISSFAESAAPGTGGEAMQQALEQFLNMPIPYYVRVDFQGFEKLVDAVGGITVHVENRLEDFAYPILGNEDVYPIENRYEHLMIEQGRQRMDGARALKYARSRRAVGIEGSDFARVKRQQNLLLALQEKILSWPTLLNPSRIARITDTLSTHIATNISVSDGLRLIDIMKKIDRAAIRQRTFSDAPESILTARIVNGAYILEPRDGNYDTLRSAISTVFEKEKPMPAITKQKKSTVALFNGTNIPGLAKSIGSFLEQQGFIITAIDNAPEKSVTKTMIIDQTQGKEYLAYDRLRLLFDAITPKKETKLPTPQAPTDFLIILGENTKLP